MLCSCAFSFEKGETFRRSKRFCADRPSTAFLRGKSEAQKGCLTFPIWSDGKIWQEIRCIDRGEFPWQIANIMINGLIPLIIVFGWVIGCYFIFGFSDGQEVPYLNHFGLSYLKHNYWSNHFCVLWPWRQSRGCFENCHGCACHKINIQVHQDSKPTSVGESVYRTNSFDLVWKKQNLRCSDYPFHKDKLWNG